MKKMGTVSIIGVGLIGGSLGAGIIRKHLACNVMGVGRNGARLKKAKEMRAVTACTTDIRRGVKDADMVVLAVPVLEINPMLERIAPFLKKGCIVTDVGSVKELIVARAEKTFEGKNVSFVGAHPMAGSEKAGIRNARAGLFEGTTCIITPTKNTCGPALETVRKIWNGMGASIMMLAPAEHDSLVAFVSHLPHILAFSLAEVIEKRRHARQAIAGGFRDMTRIAESSPALWAEICVANRKHILDSIGTFEKSTDAVKKLILRGRKESLFNKFKKGKESRKRLVK